MSEQPLQLPDSVIYAFCGHFDQSKYWRYLVPGAANELRLRIVRRKVGGIAQARIDVYGARMIRTQESASAMLPFATVPMLRKIGEAHELDVGGEKWTWTWTGLHADASSHCVTRSSWTVGDGRSEVDVAFHLSDNGKALYSATQYSQAHDLSPPACTDQPPPYASTERRDLERSGLELPGGASVLSEGGTELGDNPPPAAALLPQYATPLRPKASGGPSDNTPHALRPYHSADLPLYNGVALTRRPRSYEFKQVDAHRKKRTLQERVEEQIGDLLHRLGWPSTQSFFRGEAAAPPRFSEARYHEVIMDRLGLRHVVEVTVEMDGIWQVGRPANGQGHIYGRLFENPNQLLTFFGLPGAANAPRAMVPIELLADNITAAEMYTPGLCPTLTWRLTSRTGIENQRGSAFQGAFSPTKTTWTATSPDRDGKSKSAPLLVVHFVRGSKYEPVKRYSSLVPGEVFSVGRAGRRELRREHLDSL